MEQSHRSCRFANAANCSVAQVCEGRVFVFGSPIYNVADSEIDYSKDKVAFYKEVDGWHSLNQAPGQNDMSKTVLFLPLNIAFQVFHAFEQVDRENYEKIERLSHKT